LFARFAFSVERLARLRVDFAYYINGEEGGRFGEALRMPTSERVVSQSPAMPRVHVVAVRFPSRADADIAGSE
jgi:hypothetical protein